jgi:TolA protein
MQAQGVRFTQVQNFLISLSGHALCFLLLVGIPSCALFSRPRKPEHKIYTFDLIDPRLISMKKTQGGAVSMGKTTAAASKPAAKAAVVKKEEKKEAKKKTPEKEAAPKKAEKEAKKEAKKAGKKADTRKLPEKGFKLSKKSLEEQIKEKLKKIEEESGEGQWVEAEKADTLTTPASQVKVAEQGIAGLLNTGDFTNISYNDAVASLIYQTWQPPSKTPADREGVTVVVRFNIMRDGRVINPLVEKKSGSEVLDSSALQAIKDASPMPPLPDDYTGDSLEVCMTFVPILEEKP